MMYHIIYVYTTIYNYVCVFEGVQPTKDLPSSTMGKSLLRGEGNDPAMFKKSWKRLATR